LTFQTDEETSDRSERQVTEFEDQGVDFREVDRRYAELKQRQESGGLTQVEFEEQLKQLMVQDEEGRWWVKSRRTGDWHYYDGTTWIKDRPPGYEPLQGGTSTTPTPAPTSPRAILLRWLVPVAFVGLAVIVVAIARNTGGGGGIATPTPPSSDLPFSDDFSNTSSAWPHEKEEDGGISYKDGGYRVSAPAQNLVAVSPSETDTYQDVAVEVEAKVLNSQTDRIAAGVVCRRQDRDNYYGMIVFGKGNVSIVKVRDARLSQIEEDDRSEVIGENVGSSHVHIRGHCVGNTLTLYVDDQEVIKAEDSEFKSGYVGLIAYSEVSTAGADILFDNFSVKKP
jgi:hypothetical protein